MIPNTLTHIYMYLCIIWFNEKRVFIIILQIHTHIYVYVPQSGAQYKERKKTTKKKCIDLMIHGNFEHMFNFRLKDRKNTFKTHSNFKVSFGKYIFKLQMYVCNWNQTCPCGKLVTDYFFKITWIIMFVWK